MMNEIELDDEDFLIRVKPIMSGSSWIGEVDLSIITSGKSKLGSQDYDTLSYLCQLIISAVPTMEVDDYVRDALIDSVDEYLKNMEEEEHINFTDKSGNVINIDFSTKTKGNA